MRFVAILRPYRTEKYFSVRIIESELLRHKELGRNKAFERKKHIFRVEKME